MKIEIYKSIVEVNIGSKLTIQNINMDGLDYL